MEAAWLIGRLERIARAGAGALNPAQWEALRYLGRANRFSRTPAALADYLTSTRGTVSQTLIALDAKGYVVRERSARDRRSIHIRLTPRGEKALARDPLLALARDIGLGMGSGARNLVGDLRRALGATIARNEGRPFGLCHDCRHFRRAVRVLGRQPHHCALLDEKLSEAESESICVEQEPAALT